MSNPRLGPRASHRHAGCGHGCFCYTPQTADCRRCQNAAINAALAQSYREDQMTVEQLLDRRG